MEYYLGPGIILPNTSARDVFQESACIEYACSRDDIKFERLCNKQGYTYF